MQLVERIDTAESEIVSLRQRLRVLEDKVSEGNVVLDLLERAQPRLKGFRTKIVGWLSGLPMLTLASGFVVDPQHAVALIQEHGLLLASTQLGLSALVHYFRDKA